MRWESEQLNAGLVTHLRSLDDLLQDPTTLKTKDGEPYPLERAALDRLAAGCTREERARLRLPITVHFSADVTDSAYILDPLAAEILHRVEGWGTAYAFREGRMWMPQSLAVDLVLRYGGALQRLLL